MIALKTLDLADHESSSAVNVDTSALSSGLLLIVIVVFIGNSVVMSSPS
jgi:hypothetical protein